MTPSVSQGAAGIVYDMEKKTHGEWLMVTKRKRTVKDPAKQAFDGLRKSIQQSNKVLASLTGPESSTGNRTNAKPKRHRQESNQQTQHTPSSAGPSLSKSQPKATLQTPSLKGKEPIVLASASQDKPLTPKSPVTTPSPETGPPIITLEKKTMESPTIDVSLTGFSFAAKHAFNPVGELNVNGPPGQDPGNGAAMETDSSTPL